MQFLFQSERAGALKLRGTNIEGQCNYLHISEKKLVLCAGVPGPGKVVPVSRGVIFPPLTASHLRTHIGGIGFNGLGLSGCNNYSMIGNGVDTILSRPSGGGMHFRGGQRRTSHHPIGRRGRNLEPRLYLGCLASKPRSTFYSLLGISRAAHQTVEWGAAMA